MGGWNKRYADDSGAIDATVEHRNPNRELTFALKIAEGDTVAVNQLLNRVKFSEVKGSGEISDDPMRALKYRAVIAIAYIARVCIDHGMIYEYALRMGDFYMRYVDMATTVERIDDIQASMMRDYAEQMSNIFNKRTHSEIINGALDYILVHLSERITIEQIADNLGVTKSYLSRLFKKEMDKTVANFIKERKLEAARSLLLYTEDSMADIAAHLSFSSQSHFSQVFKDAYGVTPYQYREDNPSYYKN